MNEGTFLPDFHRKEAASLFSVTNGREEGEERKKKELSGWSIGWQRKSKTTGMQELEQSKASSSVVRTEIEGLVDTQRQRKMAMEMGIVRGTRWTMTQRTIEEA